MDYLSSVARPLSTTFGDLLLGTGASPWSLVSLALLAATFGMFFHWVKIVFKDKRIDLSFFRYFFVENRKATYTAFTGMLAGLFASFAPLDYTTISAYQVLTQAFAIGYAADNVFNKVGTAETDDLSTDGLA